jgi:hypothetical protein
MTKALAQRKPKEPRPMTMDDIAVRFLTTPPTPKQPAKKPAKRAK